MTRRLCEIVRGEAGSIAIAGGVAILVFAILGGTVIEVGQWFQHRRNLQVRTDAAAFSAAQALNACFNIGTTQFPTEQDADTYIEGWAHDYSGVPAIGQTRPLYNRRFNDPVPLVSFQSDSFPSNSTPQPTRNLGPECFNDSDPTNTDPSNLNLMADVRTTQEGISPFFSFSPLATVHGWARVQLQAVKALKPTMPLAIPDVNPKHVAVTLVDNSTGNALLGCPNPGCVYPLAGPQSSGTLNDWSGQATIPAQAAGTNVGIRVSVGSQNGSCAGINEATTYKCYDYSTGGGSDPNGILAVRAYNATAAGSTTAPVLRDVTPATCSGTPYFSTYQATGGTCAAVVSANVDFGSGADLTKAQVTGSLTGSKGGGINFTLTHLGTGNTWDNTSSPISLSVEGGPYRVTLSWKYGSSKGDFNSGKAVQQIFSASDGSDSTLPGGPIMAGTVLFDPANPGDPSAGLPTFSVPAGSPATVAVVVGLTGGVHVNPKCSDANGNSGQNYRCPNAQEPTGYDPPVILRAASTSGSLNFAINCGVIPGNAGPNNPLYQMIRYGCRDSFSINGADVCPDPANPTPTSCAPVQQVTGDKVGPVQQALNDRLAPGGNCVANNYPLTAVPDDQRVMLLIDTDFTAFSGSGGSAGSDVPVITFATFYVTGWDGADNSCATLNEPAPPNADTKGNSADIWGHFINYDTPGIPSGIKCDIRGLAPCVGALVR